MVISYPRLRANIFKGHMITFNALPRREDFFPKLRRGHGTAHQDYFVDDERVVHLNPKHIEHPCVDVTCELNMPSSKNAHHDTQANMRDWCQERGVSDKVIKHTGPMVTMLLATGGR